MRCESEVTDALSAPDATQAAAPAASLPAAKPPTAAPATPPTGEDKPVPRSLRSRLLIALAVALVLAAALYLLRNLILGTPTPVYIATQAQLVQNVVASGRVVSPQRISVALQGSGRVLRVAARLSSAGSC